MRKNILVNGKNLLKLGAEGREICNVFEITRAIYLNSERSDQFLEQNVIGI